MTIALRHVYSEKCAWLNAIVNIYFDGATKKCKICVTKYSMEIEALRSNWRCYRFFEKMSTENDLWRIVLIVAVLFIVSVTKTLGRVQSLANHIQILMFALSFVKCEDKNSQLWAHFKLNSIEQRNYSTRVNYLKKMQNRLFGTRN